MGTLSAITAWLLAGLIAWETVVAFFGHAAVSLPTPAYWPAFLALGALGGVHDRKRRPFAAVSILALALLAATLPAADAFSVLTDGFVLAVAAMAGLGIGRTAALLIERRHSAPGFVPHGVTPPYRQRRHRPSQGSVR